MRKVLAVIAGIVAAFVIVICVDLLALLFHPAPPMRPGPEATAAWLADAPITALAVIVLAWFLAPLLGGFAALRISRWPASAWIVTLAILASALLGVFRPPHPLWMQVGAVVAPLLGGWLASRLPWAASTTPPDAA